MTRAGRQVPQQVLPKPEPLTPWLHIDRHLIEFETITSPHPGLPPRLPGMAPARPSGNHLRDR